MAPYYAYEAFPWADIDPSLTIPGLCSHRWTLRRQEWSRVIAGSDEQIGTALGNIIPPHQIFGEYSDAERSAIHFAWCSGLAHHIDAYCGRVGKAGRVDFAERPAGFDSFLDGWNAHKKHSESC